MSIEFDQSGKKILFVPAVTIPSPPQIAIKVTGGWVPWFEEMGNKQCLIAFTNQTKAENYINGFLDRARKGGHNWESASFEYKVFTPGTLQELAIDFGLPFVGIDIERISPTQLQGGFYTVTPNGLVRIPDNNF